MTPRSGAPRRLLVDTCAWLAFFSARDQQHARAHELMSLAITGKHHLLTTQLILAEVHRLLLFRAGIAPAAEAISRIEASPRVTVVFTDQAQHQAARDWLKRVGDQRITYTDATSFAVMNHRRCDAAISFDRDFVVAGFALWSGAA